MLSISLLGDSGDVVMGEYEGVFNSAFVPLKEAINYLSDFANIAPLPIAEGAYASYLGQRECNAVKDALSVATVNNVPGSAELNNAINCYAGKPTYYFIADNTQQILQMLKQINTSIEMLPSGPVTNKTAIAAGLSLLAGFAYLVYADS